MASLPQLVQFLKDVRAESSRVQWPNLNQTTRTTLVVLGFVVVTGIFLSGADMLISMAMELVLR